MSERVTLRKRGSASARRGREAHRRSQTHWMTVVEQAVGPDQVEVVCKGLLCPVRLLLDLLEERRQVHRVLDYCSGPSEDSLQMQVKPKNAPSK